MDKHRVGPVLLLGMFIMGLSGLATADGGYRGHGWHSNVGVGIMVDPFLFMPGYYPRSYYYPPYYYSPYYYPPAVVTVPTEPPVYIEREEATAPVPQASASWYYCTDPQGYYPYVNQCPGGWQAVSPRPSTAPEEGR